MSGRRSKLGAWVIAALAGTAALGCGDNNLTVDQQPIPLTRAPLGDGTAGGALLALARLPGGGAPFSMVVDTGSPVTIIGATSPGSGTLTIAQRGFDLLDATATAPQPVRARFRDLGLFSLQLGAVGSAATIPGGVLGGDLLRAFSTELRFEKRCAGAAAPDDAGAPDAGVSAAGPGCSSVTFWNHQGATLGFLEDAGYAVLRFTPFGGGETTANSEPDFLGLQGPVTIPATRVVMRACAAPDTFTPTVEPKTCCTRGAEIANATGVDLSLLLATGVGPMVLSQTAWNRVAAKLATAPAMSSAPLLVATWPTPIAATWTTMPRFALVDGFDPPSTGDEGPCVNLGRSRRIEWTAVQTANMQQAHPAVAACVQPCDTDPSEPSEALSSAAYIELGGAIPVAIVADTEPFLQALRFDIRPRGTGHRRPRGRRRARRRAPRARLPRRPAARDLLVRARRRARRLLRGGALPAPARSRPPAPVLRARPAARRLDGLRPAERLRAVRLPVRFVTRVGAARAPISACTMSPRMRFAVALGLAAFLSLAAAKAEARVRVAISDFTITGGDSPTLATQLQNGFILGLVRGGIQVVDSVETAKKLDGHPDRQQCDDGPCLKALGQQLDVSYVVHAHVDVAGNSYNMVARVFSTEGTPSAALPVATKSRTCDVCTVAEARDGMLRLADTLRPQIVETAAQAQAQALSTTPRAPGVAMPIVAAMTGLVAVAVGAAILGSNGTCTGTLCSENRSRSALGGAFIGAGAVAAVAGGYVTFARLRNGDPVMGVAMAFQF